MSIIVIKYKNSWFLSMSKSTWVSLSSIMITWLTISGHRDPSCQVVPWAGSGQPRGSHPCTAMVSKVSWVWSAWIVTYLLLSGNAPLHWLVMHGYVDFILRIYVYVSWLFLVAFIYLYIYIYIDRLMDIDIYIYAYECACVIRDVAEHKHRNSLHGCN